jgi:hypothetical protein
MFGKPGVESLEGAFAERERRVRRILDLRHRRASNARENGQLRAVKLTVGKLRCQKEQRGDGRCGGERAAPCGFDDVCGGLFAHWFGPFLHGQEYVHVHTSTILRSWPLRRRRRRNILPRGLERAVKPPSDQILSKKFAGPERTFEALSRTLQKE